MLLNWFLSSLSEDKHLRSALSSQDLKILGIQYCTHLLAAGVLRQISDKDAPTESIFKPNLMYFWSHMEMPVSQPVTPGKLDMSSWPPEREVNHQQRKQDNYCPLENEYNKNNNEEISDIVQAKLVISKLKSKLEELEYQLQNYKHSPQYGHMNKNLNNSFMSTPENLLNRDRTELVNREVQTNNVNEFNRLADKPVINTNKHDNNIRTSVYNDSNLGLSKLGYRDEVLSKDIENKPESRSEKIENYCKLNKSRDYNKSYKKDGSGLHMEGDNKMNGNQEIGIASSDIINSYENKKHLEELNANVTHESSSDASFISTTCDLLNSNDSNKSSDINMSVSTRDDSKNILSNQLSSEISNISPAEPKTLSDNFKQYNETKLVSLNSNLSLPLCKGPSEKDLCQPSPAPPPPLPGMSPSPPPMPGTNNQSFISTSSTQETSKNSHKPEIPSSLISKTTHNQFIVSTCEMESQKIPHEESQSLPPLHLLMSEKEPLSQKNEGNLSSLPSYILAKQSEGKLTPQKEALVPSLTTSGAIPHPPSPTALPEMAPPPPPPPMPGMPPTPPSMPGMGPPPPPMPVIGPPPPPMPGIGPPPPPPMPGMGPPPPPMPGMGPPPPPPMPGMGPAPPPLPGMGPPPPPMPGMGPPPPPMPGMGPPPPPLPGMGPPPPPMAGLGPPPPPIPGVPPPPPSIGQSGPVPFPAPPVGGWNMQRATMRKVPVKPAAPMKPLYWTRILAASLPPSQAEVDSSGYKPLWLEIEEAKLDNIDEFADLFSRQVVKAPVKKKVEVKTKIQPIKILDSKRSQNVGILAQSLHVEFSEIENAIYNFDTSVVSLEALQQIYELRASEEELMLIKEHLQNKPDIPLDKPEAFLHDLSGIQNFAERISCFTFQAEFDDAVNTIMHKLDNLKHTCEFLITSEPLKQLFAIILTLGNYMNGGNCQRGQADGFGLEILAKLKDVKSKQSNVTLLHFIVRTYMRARGGALAGACALPVPEPGDVTRAAAIDFADVAANLATLRTKLDECRDKMEKVIEADALQKIEDENSGVESTKRLEVFKDKMTTFLNAAEEKLKTENENLSECRNKFIATVKFYHYSPKCGKVDDCEPKEFFCLWTSFCSDFKDIYKKEEQIAIKEKLKETKKLQCERKANTQTQPKKEGGLKARLQKLSSVKK